MEHVEHVNYVAGLAIIGFLTLLAIGIAWLNDRGHKKDR